MNGIQVGGRFFAFGSNYINLEGVSLSEVEFTSLLGNFSRGYFENVEAMVLNGHLITDNHADMIGEGMKANSTLRQLHLNKNGIGDRGVELILKGLKDNTTLQMLHLVMQFYQYFAAVMLVA
jgi:hypothetical protein